MTDRDRDLDEEIGAHLRMAIEERMAHGETRADAERAVRREFGNVTHIKEVTREQRGGVWLDRLVQDLRYGLRALRRTPGFTVSAIGTLALAIGANTAVFTVVDSVLLRPLPFASPERLEVVSYLPTDLPFVMSPAIVDRDWLVYRERQHSFSAITAYRRNAITLSGRGEALRLTGALVDADFFNTLGRQPEMGRAFRKDEEDADEKVALLSDRLWRNRFASDSAVLGATIALDGQSYRVIGVMPPGFSFPQESDIWTPIHVRLNSRNAFFIPVIGRLRDGATREQAQIELASFMKAQPRDTKDTADHKPAAMVAPLRDVLTGDVAKSLWILAGAVGFVLLIACANVANLLLIRATARRHEMAVRVAIGAGPLRIVRQLLTESLLLAAAGALLGLAVARIFTRVLIAIAPPGRIPRLAEVHVGAGVFAFTLAVAVLSGIAFGMVPALQSARRAPHDALASSGRTVAGSHGRVRGVLVAAEVALALMLLTGAGLMIKSFMRLRAVDKGFDGASVMTMSVDLPTLAYPDSNRMRAFHAAVLRELARIPGVRSVGAVSWRPLGGVGMMGDFAAEHSVKPRGFSVDKSLVSPGYFTTMGLRVVRGRDFTDHDGPAVILSESVARRLWPGADPIGKRVSMKTPNPSPESWLTVVGVVSDVVHDRSMSKHAAMYFPYQQSGWSFVLSHMTYVVRTAPGAQVVPALRAALRSVDPTIPAQQVMSMDEALMDVVAEPVFETRLLIAFALIAVLLAAIGTYGVLAYDVAQRSRELAVLMALGASQRHLIVMVMRRTGTLALIGAAAGVAGSLGVTRVLKASLFEVHPTDPTTIVLVVLTILAVAAAAGAIPARRAAGVDVLTALSGEG